MHWQSPSPPHPTVGCQLIFAASRLWSNVAHKNATHSQSRQTLKRHPAPLLAAGRASAPLKACWCPARCVTPPPHHSDLETCSDIHNPCKERIANPPQNTCSCCISSYPWPSLPSTSPLHCQCLLCYLLATRHCRPATSAGAEASSSQSSCCCSRIESCSRKGQGSVWCRRPQCCRHLSKQASNTRKLNCDGEL